jgi:hypothetical protein
LLRAIETLGERLGEDCGLSDPEVEELLMRRLRGED